MIKVINEKTERVCQGDIFRDIECIEYADIKEEGILEISKINYPYVLVLTQDCDLEQDYNNRNEEKANNNDKHILSIIVVPLYNIEHVYLGEHLSELNLQMQSISKKPDKSDNKNLRNNQNPRYHFLDFSNDVPIVNSVIDFKHFFTVNNEYLKRMKATNYICKIAELYREQISLRFSNYLSRIGLPNK